MTESHDDAGVPRQKPAPPASLPRQTPPAHTPDHAGPSSSQDVAPARRRRWVLPVTIAATAAVGIALGAGMSSGDPAGTPEYRELATERDQLEAAVAAAEERAAEADASTDALAAAADERAADLDEREAALDAREAALDERETGLADREAAVTATEERVAASRIGVGTWTVGVDIEPGTYRMSEPVTEMCYWGIYRSGTNKSDIIDNDLVQGGHPSVTLREGQDFENQCGVWDKQ